jgi:iron complex outermembrane receptor protein
MKKVQLIVLLALMLCLAKAYGQAPAGKIEGMVKDADANLLPAASVTLKKAKDSSIVKIEVADKNGAFLFENLPFETYFLTVTAVGFQGITSDPIQLSSAQLNYRLPAFTMSPEAKAVGGVTVTSRKPLVEARPGMMVVNVDASPTNAGLNALELLEKSPGITVDNEGNISLKGKQGVLVLIDGKPTYMSSADLAAFLKNMQANNIQSVEIMTNPPAKYDAAGNSGIINIKTKKNIIKGMNGSVGVGYTQGVYPRGFANLNLNYRNDKFNLFGSYNPYRFAGFNELDIKRTGFAADKVTPERYINQISRNKFWGFGQNFKVGLDYSIKKDEIIGVLVNVNLNDNDERSHSNMNLLNADRDLTSILKSAGTEGRKFLGVTSNLNYKKTLNKEGREFSADLDYAFYDSRNKNTLNTTVFDNANNMVSSSSLLTNMPSRIDIYSAKADYVHPFKNKWKLETGLKSSWVNTDNTAEYLRRVSSDWVKDPTNENAFDYKENINALYGSLSGDIKKWTVVAGLRLEHTYALGKQVMNDSTFKRNYVNLFPNLGLGYNFNENNQLNLAYGRRIERPSYDNLNPFVFFLDSLTYNQGNPYLKPQITDNIELSHTLMKFITTTVNYSVTNDVIAEMLKQEGSKTFQTRENVAKMSQVGLAVMINTPVKKWWTISTYLNVYNNHFEGFYNGDPIDIQMTTFMGNMSNSFNLGNGWNAELSGWYRSKGTEGLLVLNDLWAMNAGVSKQVLKKKGTIRLSVRDMFYSQKVSGHVLYSDIDVNLANVRDTRQVSLGFTYRFGKTNIAQARQRKSGSSDEQNRVGGGGGQN